MTSFWLDYLCKDPVSKKGHIHSYSQLGLEHIFYLSFGRHQINLVSNIVIFQQIKDTVTHLLNILHWLSIVISVRFQILTLDQKFCKSNSLSLWPHPPPPRRPAVQPQLSSLCASNMPRFMLQGNPTCSLLCLHPSFHTWLLLTHRSWFHSHMSFWQRPS